MTPPLHVRDEADVQEQRKKGETKGGRGRKRGRSICVGMDVCPVIHF